MLRWAALQSACLVRRTRALLIAGAWHQRPWEISGTDERMRVEQLVLGLVALATCVATYNSVQYLAWGIRDAHRQGSGVERQLLEGGASTCQPNGSGCLKGQSSRIRLDRPAPNAAGAFSRSSLSAAAAPAGTTALLPKAERQAAETIRCWQAEAQLPAPRGCATPWSTPSERTACQAQHCAAWHTCKLPVQQPGALCASQTLQSPQLHLPAQHTAADNWLGRYWGDAVVWGDKHLQPSAAACCEACAKYKPPTDNEFSCNGALLNRE